VPDKLKIAKVIPLFKKGDRCLLENYRPISLLSIFNKLLEKVVYKRVYNFLNKNEVLYKYQFGFRKKFQHLLPFWRSRITVINILMKVARF
jgi:hypothetical protein